MDENPIEREGLDNQLGAMEAIGAIGPTGTVGLRGAVDTPKEDEYKEKRVEVENEEDEEEMWRRVRERDGLKL